MQFGINLAPGAETWKIVQRAEELGFAHAWFIDSQLINADLFVAMTAAAMTTKSIALATGMLIPSNRIAPVAANGLASLNALAPRRIHFGVATGFTARRSMGLPPVKLDEMKEYIRVVQGLLAGETVEAQLEGKRRKIRFLNPELGLVNLRDPIPLHISALGPRVRQYAAEIGAGFVVPVGTLAGAEAQMKTIREAWRAAGRDEASLEVTAMGNGCVLADGEPYDSPRAIAQAGPGLVIILHDLVEETAHVSTPRPQVPALAAALEAFRKIYDSYAPADARYLELHRGHLMTVRPEEAKLVTAELVRAMTFTGPIAEIRDKLRALGDMGFARFNTHVRHGHPGMAEDWARVAEGV